MNPPLPHTTAPVSLTKRLLICLGLAAVAVVTTQLSIRALRDVEANPPAPASVPRFRLEVRDGRFHRRSAPAPYTGWVTDHFKDGTVELRSAVVDGRLHGESVGWLTNGAIALREYFARGIPNGTRTTWHPDGQIRSEGLLVEGKQHGRYRQWHENGTLAAEAEFQAGKAHGLSRAWYASGCLKAEAIMEHGEIVTRRSYPDGVQRQPTLLAGPASPSASHARTQ